MNLQSITVIKNPITGTTNIVNSSNASAVFGATAAAAWPSGQVLLLDRELSPTLVTTGDTHTNTTIDALASVTGITVGMAVSGTGVAAGTVVSSIDSATAITVSLATTATAAGVTLTFGGRYATTTNLSVTLTSVGSPTLIRKGDYISGTGIPAGTYVVSVNGTSVTMSAAATASATVLVDIFFVAANAQTGWVASENVLNGSTGAPIAETLGVVSCAFTAAANTEYSFSIVQIIRGVQVTQPITVTTGTVAPSAGDLYTLLATQVNNYTTAGIINVTATGSGTPMTLTAGTGAPYFQVLNAVNVTPTVSTTGVYPTGVGAELAVAYEGAPFT